MNWKNINLGQKLGVGFGALIVIALTLGLLAVYNMSNIKTQATFLADEFVPLVEMGASVERYTSTVMTAARDYGLSGNINRYNEAIENIRKVKDVAQETRQLVMKANNLTDFREQIDEVIKSADNYEKLIQETYRLNSDLDKNRAVLDESAATFTKTIIKFQRSQESQLVTDVESGLAKAAVVERAEKVSIASQIMDTGNEIRVANFKGQALRDVTYFNNAMPNFDAIAQLIEKLRPITRKAENIQQLDNTEEAAIRYKASLLSVSDIYQKLAALQEQRATVGQGLLEGAQKMASSGLSETGKVADNAISSINVSNSIMLWGLLFATLIGIGFAVVITSSITGPIVKGVAFAQEIAAGNLTAKIDVDQKDEIGRLAQALRDMSAKLRDVIQQVSQAGDNIAAASFQMSSSSQQVSQGATEQAASAEEVSSSMEEMAANIQQNTDNAQQTEKIAIQASNDVKRGSDAVNETVDSMRMIANKISIIGEIARQTNLLALNAAVEAARAGEHGKGFAVVAAEVRKLAERSQIAANEIDELSNKSVMIAEKSGKLLSEIVPKIRKTAELVQEISSASIEQNTGAEQVNTAIQQLNSVTQQNAAAAEEMATSSEELSSQAEQLKEVIGYFRLDHHQSHSSFSERKIKKAAPAPILYATAHNFGGNFAKTAKAKAKKSGGIDLDMGHQYEHLDDAYEKF